MYKVMQQAAALCTFMHTSSGISILTTIKTQVNMCRELGGSRKGHCCSHCCEGKRTDVSLSYSHWKLPISRLIRHGPAAAPAHGKQT